jgi:hypothetical protein
VDDRRVRLRSYRLAFELERRIHRIDSFRIPLPYGLPLAALGWGAATLVAVLIASSLPAIGALLGLVPMPVRLLFIPGAAAHLLCRATADGRPVHEALLARAAFATRPKKRLGLDPLAPFELSDAALPCAPDERGDTYRAGTIAGPALLALRLPARVVIEGRSARLVPAERRAMLSAQEVCLREGQRLVVV